MKKRIATLFLTTILPTALFANEDGLSSDLLDRVNSAARVPSAALGAAMSGVDQTFAVTSARETASRAAFEAFTSTSPGGMVEAAGALEGVPQAAFGMPASSPDQMVGAMGAPGGVPQAAVATPASNPGRMEGAWGAVPQAAVAAPASNPYQMVGAPGDTPQAALGTPASNLGGMVGAAGALEGTSWATRATALMLGNAANAERESKNVPVGLRSFSATGTEDSR